ncbi:MAG TPA: hypothetical protein VM925_35375 [Labilithrix sp.]|nr:hypothetical protein [Labilithrix sp.]
MHVIADLAHACERLAFSYRLAGAPSAGFGGGIGCGGGIGNAFGGSIDASASGVSCGISSGGGIGAGSCDGADDAESSWATGGGAGAVNVSFVDSRRVDDTAGELRFPRAEVTVVVTVDVTGGISNAGGDGAGATTRGRDRPGPRQDTPAAMMVVVLTTMTATRLISVARSFGSMRWRSNASPMPEACWLHMCPREGATRHWAFAIIARSVSRVAFSLALDRLSPENGASFA